LVPLAQVTGGTRGARTRSDTVETSVFASATNR
jgi:hypothetical protein